MITTRYTLQLLIALCITLPTISLAAGSTSTTTTKVVSTSTPSVSTTTTIAPPTPKSVETTLSPAAQDRLKKLTALMSKKDDAIVRRLGNVIGRLETRLTTLQGSGADVTSARTHLNEAKAALAKAEGSLNTIDKAVANFIGSATPRESWSSLKLTYTDINKNIHTAYDAIVVTLNDTMNASMVTPPTTSTTTASTSPAV